MSTNHTLLANALANLDKAAAKLDGEVSKDLLCKIREPKERIELRLSPKLSDGKIHVFRAFVVRHSDALGPSKGGIRMTPTVTLEDVNGLAMEMTWKCALIGVPFGGGKSGIIGDARSMTPDDKETLIRSFARHAHRHIGPQVYVPAPDMGTSETEMGYIKDAISYSMGQSTTDGCYVTGKPVILGGIPGRREATGRGVVITACKAMEACGISANEASVIVQGFGNVGSVAAKAMHDLGATVVGVSDLTAAIHDPNGLDIPALVDYTAANGGIKGFPGAKEVDGAQLLEMPCDVLIPAADAGQITIENASRIQAKIVAEGANGPTTPDADEILIDRGVLVIPDILCNAGGVFVSYLEYTQETQQEQMLEEVVQERLQKRMADRFDKVYNLAAEKGMQMRDAAMHLAVRTVCQALTARGYLP